MCPLRYIVLAVSCLVALIMLFLANGGRSLLSLAVVGSEERGGQEKSRTATSTSVSSQVSSSVPAPLMRSDLTTRSLSSPAHLLLPLPHPTIISLAACLLPRSCEGLHASWATP